MNLPKTVKRNKRSGAILVLAAVIMTVVFAFAAFSVDIGYIAYVRAELQNAADAAALAGARGLYESPDMARQKAKGIAFVNQAANEPVTLDLSQDVEIGHWDRDTATFHVLEGENEVDGNAVRVHCELSAERGNQLKLFISPVIGVNSSEVQANSIALLESQRCGRFVGIESADVISGYTDSYNSDLGSYASQTAGNEGNVCSNGAIEVQNAIVNGDASPGDGEQVWISGQGAVTGSKRSHEPISYPAIDVGDAPFNNDNQSIPQRFWNKRKSLKVSGAEQLTFEGGTLYIENNFTVSGEMRIAGPTNIFVGGKMDVTGQGIINLSQKPMDLQIFLLGNSRNATAKQAGGADFYGIVYGPRVPVVVSGNAHYFGAAVGKTLKLSTTAGVHFDEAIDPFDESLVRATLVE